MSNEILKIEFKEYCFTVSYDDDNPGLDDLFQCDVTFISNHRDFKNHGPQSEIEMENLINSKGVLKKSFQGYKIVSIHALIHGQYALSLNPFSCKFDSGIFGALLFKVGEFGKKDCGLEGFIRGMESLINGEIFYYTIEKKETCNHCGHNEWQLVDSCGGFYGYESDSDMITCMLENADIENEIIKGLQKTYNKEF